MGEAQKGRVQGRAGDQSAVFRAVKPVAHQTVAQSRKMKAKLMGAARYGKEAQQGKAGGCLQRLVSCQRRKPILADTAAEK